MLIPLISKKNDGLNQFLKKDKNRGFNGRSFNKSDINNNEPPLFKSHSHAHSKAYSFFLSFFLSYFLSSFLSFFFLMFYLSVFGRATDVFYVHIFFGSNNRTQSYNTCNGLMVCMNGTTSVPKSILHYVVDKVKLFVPI